MLDAAHSFSSPADEAANASAAAASSPAPAARTSHAARHTPLPLRNDTILGVCEAIGQDFGFHPNVLRIALALGLFVNASAMVVLYLGLGVAVAVSRWLYPRPVAAAASATPDSARTGDQPLPLAA